MSEKEIKYFITGGCGFIGSHFIDLIINKKNTKVINLDLMTYASNKEFNKRLLKKKNYKFIKGNINNAYLVTKILNFFKPNYIINFAAETHVDNSIKNNQYFIESNILGVHCLLVSLQKYLYKNKKNNFKKFLQISTDEVYGDSFNHKKKFDENNRYKPSSPYSASKASADHLVEAWGRTYKIPYNITISVNNFGQRQNIEKFIPKIITCLKDSKKIPLYGDGKNERDWIYVKDNAQMIFEILKKGTLGKKYNISFNQRINNLNLIKKIIKIYNKINDTNFKIKDVINFVMDRPGHDRSYKVNNLRLREIINKKFPKKMNLYLHKTITYYTDKNFE